MNKFFKIYFLLFLLLTVSCVSYSKKEISSGSEQKNYPADSGSSFKNYWNNRIMDARDIFSIQVIWGLNLGAKAQISRTGVGLYWEAGSTHPVSLSGEAGMRSGEAGTHAAEDLTVLVFSSESYQPVDTQKRIRAELRKKIEDNKDPSLSNPASWTRLGIAGGLLIGIRAELNPGELIDFILGLFGADIYGDDVYKKTLPSR